jgi:hypothetical protein
MSSPIPATTATPGVTKVVVKKPVIVQNPITQIAIVNASTTVTDTEVVPVVAALQVQVDRDYTPIWHTQAKITFYPKGQNPPADAWQLALLDNSDLAGALGYHDITPNGQPLGKSFVGTDKQYGLSWSITTSHELLEMLTDPWINLTVFDQITDTGGRLYAYEVCDACEDDSFGYDINGVMVSDFVTPAWFEGWRVTNSTMFDFKKHITAPYMLLSGGYISYFDVGRGNGWQQLNADAAPAMKSRAPVGSRRERRAIDKTRWVHSTS